MDTPTVRILYVLVLSVRDPAWWGCWLWGGRGGWFGFEDGMREDEEGRKVSREGRQDGKVVLRFP